MDPLSDTHSDVTGIDSNAIEAGKNIKQFRQEFSKSDDIGSIYDKWTDYEKDFRGIHYISPGINADFIEQWVPADMRSTASIMDIASGTGFVGEELHRRGFRVIDGVDPSAKCLDVAREKNIYRRLICDFVTDKHLDVHDDTYDVVTTCGSLSVGHLPAVAIHEFIRIAKPGGLICFTGRKTNWDTIPEYNDVLKTHIKQLQDAGTLKLLAAETTPNASFMDKWEDTFTMVFRKS